MANAPVLKTGGRKPLGVRIPRPPSDLRTVSRPTSASRWNEKANGVALLSGMQVLLHGAHELAGPG